MTYLFNSIATSAFYLSERRDVWRHSRLQCVTLHPFLFFSHLLACFLLTVRVRTDQCRYCFLRTIQANISSALINHVMKTACEKN